MRFSPADESAYSRVYKTASRVLLKQIGPKPDQNLGFSKITGLAHSGHRVNVPYLNHWVDWEIAS